MDVNEGMGEIGIKQTYRILNLINFNWKMVLVFERESERRGEPKERVNSKTSCSSMVMKFSFAHGRIHFTIRRLL